jgi:ribosomal protein L32
MTEHADACNLSADAILCQDCSICKRSSDVNCGKFEISETNSRYTTHYENREVEGT